MKRDARRMVRWLIVMVAAVMMAALPSCRPAEKPAASGADGDAAIVVAKIGDVTITKAELTERLAQEVRPQRYDYDPTRPPATPEGVLQRMLAEKAIALEARQQGVLEDDTVRSSVDRFRTRQLISSFVNDYVMENVPVSESEIKQAVSEDPNLSSEQAEMKVRSAKVRPVLDAFYQQLLEKFKVEKVTENFQQVSRIYQRLKMQPKEPRKQTVFWITNKQIHDELTDEEKQIVLARYTGGQVTLLDWFKTLSDIAPPGRPKNLRTSEGVDQLLDRTLQPVIWMAEAVARGYDKNEQFLEQLRAREDMFLLGKVRSDKYKQVEKPSDEEVKAFFEANPERFAKNASLKVEQIWCADRKTAEQARQMLADGASGESVNEAHGLRESAKAYNIFPSSEGVFWDELWKAEPNDVVGPVKGFSDTGIQWRVVKVLEKTPAEASPYSDTVANQAQSALMSQKREAIMAAYEAELLAKYPHEVYADKIKDIDPLAVTPVEEEGR